VSGARRAELKVTSGNVVSGATTTWSLSNSALATVSANGLVSAVAVGTETMTGKQP
jgi:uncharacterized protein YjdB